MANPHSKATTTPSIQASQFAAPEDFNALWALVLDADSAAADANGRGENQSALAFGRFASRLQSWLHEHQPAPSSDKTPVAPAHSVQQTDESHRDPRLGDFAWALDQESFHQDSFSGFMKQLAFEGRLEAGVVVYYGRIDQRAAASFMPSAVEVLELAADAAYQYANELAGNFARDTGRDGLQALEDAMGVWANKHLSVDFFLVPHSKPYTLTEEDCAAARGS